MSHRIDLMKSGVLLLLTFLFLTTTFAQSDQEIIADIKDYRAKQAKEFKDKEKSPLSKTDRRKFKGLNYYPIDLKYRVKARFIKTENPVFFKMKTTTERTPDYVKFGEVHFEIENLPYKLEVYQSPDIAKRPGYEDYLFIPFTDLTNGEETYEVGRYMEFRIPNTEEVIIDFNKCYNPYCSYGTDRYSCPIPPAPNQLPVAIRAGEKKFH